MTDLRPTTKHRRSRADGDRGAALVEAALIIPVVVIILFGVIEFGFLFATAQTANSSARAGARQAAQQYALTPGSTSADQVKAAVVADLKNLDGFGTPVEMWIYQADANGDYVSDASFGTCNAGNCIRYFGWNGSDFTTVSGSWGPGGGEGTPDACGATVDSVGVYTVVSHKYIAGIFGRTQSVTENTVMRFEPKPTGCPAGST